MDRLINGFYRICMPRSILGGFIYHSMIEYEPDDIQVFKLADGPGG